MILIKKLIFLLIISLAACNQAAKPDQINENPINSYQKLSTNYNSETDNSTESHTTQIMFLVKQGENPQIIAHEYGMQLEHSYDEMNMAAALINEDQIGPLQNDPRVIHVEYDKPMEVKPVQVSDWGIEQVQAPKAHASNFTGKGVKVAVIDSGVAPHEDLVITNGVSLVDYTTSYYDDNGHGTHVAGIIGAKNNEIGIVGVAPESEIYAVKVLDQNGEGYTSDVIAGIDWAIQNGVDIINLSLGGPQHSAMLEAIINSAVEQNIVVVAASGNEGTTEGTQDTVSYPARYPNVIAVGAIDQNNVRAFFSSTGNTVEFAAPGVDIGSTFLNNTYAQMDGTSSAAPFVAGIAALMKQNNPDITVSQLRANLQKESIDLGAAGRDSWYGFGLVQAPYYFKDISGHWARNDIISVYQKNWMIGAKENTFSPQNFLTRAEAATVFTRVLGLTATEEVEVPADVPSDHWAIDNIKAVLANSIMIGDKKNNFLPGSYLTREQVAVMLYRALNPVEEGTTNPFQDLDPSRWSYQEILALNNMGIVKGVSVTNFAPTKSLTRAEMAALLNRVEPYFGG